MKRKIKNIDFVALKDALSVKLNAEEISVIINACKTNLKKAAKGEKGLCFGIGDFVSCGEKRFFVHWKWDIDEENDYYVTGVEITEYALTKEGKIESKLIARLGYWEEINVSIKHF